MKRGAVLLLLLGQVALGSGCTVVVASAAVAGAVVSTAGKVTATTVKTTGRVVTSAVSATGSVAVTSLEAAARLARRGMVVAVDPATGEVTEIPWERGLRLQTATRSGQIAGRFNRAHLFRDGQVQAIDLRRVRAGREDRDLQDGDVIELRL